MSHRLLPVLLALGLASAPAAHAQSVVTAQFQAFSPGQVDVLPGETIRWQNVSDRTHTVTADDESFDSGDLLPGTTFEHAFAAPGSFPYHCRIHPGMVGEVDVTPVLLDQLPTLAVPAGDPVTFSGRTADPASTVRVERAVGDSYETMATTQPAADGTWRVALQARSSGDYRAANEAGASQTRRLLVSDRQVIVRPTREGLAVTVTPPVPYGRIALQLDLRDRFGWWPSVRTRLDYVSQARFRVPRRTRARVVLLADDGWTALATSKPLLSGRSPSGSRRRSDGDARASSPAHPREVPARALGGGVRP
jgi:plastocyanin